MANTSTAEYKLRFNGSNWEDLDRLIALSRFHFLQDDDYDDNEPRKCAYLASYFEGPALDWAASAYAAQPAIFEGWDGFIVAVKQVFGVEANNVTALRRKALDELRWSSDVPVFFANFDRLTHQLGITDHTTKISMVQSKLPTSMKETLAVQALDFANYETMRERLNTMWALNPHKHIDAVPTKRPRCGNCGKKGHTAQGCRAAKN
jgi:hypothetical protein